MTFTHLDAEQRPTMVDVSDKVATKRTATAEARVRFPAGRCRGAARQRPAFAARDRYSIPPSSPASWARSAPMS